jgi:arsenite methyltransferase
MPVACPIDLDTQLLRSEVSKVYSRVAADPDGDFHFHRGPIYAADLLGYDPVEINQISMRRSKPWERSTGTG